MEENQLAVKCKNLIKIYGEGTGKIVALRGIDLEVKSGELMMLAGPSGCGKTTLISVIASILDQDSGECKVYGHELKDLNKDEKIAFRAKNIGFVFQAFNLFPTLTAAENVAIPLIIGGMDHTVATQKGADLLEQMGLGDRATSFPTDLSGGQQQRVAIARALIHNPRLIVCDEPTSALDGETGHKIMELMKSIAVDKTRTLIVVTHDSRIFQFADRIAKMEDGHILKVTSNYKEFE
ncbi:MAG: ABC transporter ATP-binding protein [Alphaproteobacteria bacterium 41-28]|nr:MAG: ABC transporter ATP-binding protein [Alphaproteobacteria bacterium 41-28]